MALGGREAGLKVYRRGLNRSGKQFATLAAVGPVGPDQFRHACLFILRGMGRYPLTCAVSNMHAPPLNVMLTSNALTVLCAFLK